MISISLGLTNSMKGKTTGLTGLYDGDQSNDFTYRNGTGQIPITSAESLIFSWASDCEFSLFLI